MGHGGVGMSERTLLSPYPNSPWSDECCHAPDERCEHCTHVTDEELYAYYGYDNCNILGICGWLMMQEHEEYARLNGGVSEI